MPRKKRAQNKPINTVRLRCALQGFINKEPKYFLYEHKRNISKHWVVGAGSDPINTCLRMKMCTFNAINNCIRYHPITKTVQKIEISKLRELVNIDELNKKSTTDDDETIPASADVSSPQQVVPIDDDMVKYICTTNDLSNAFEHVKHAYTNMWKSKQQKSTDVDYQQFIKARVDDLEKGGPFSMKVIQEMLRAKGFVLRILYKPTKYLDLVTNTVKYEYGLALNDTDTKKILQSHYVFMDRFDLDTIRFSIMRILLFLYPIGIKSNYKGDPILELDSALNAQTDTEVVDVDSYSNKFTTVEDKPAHCVALPGDEKILNDTKVKLPASLNSKVNPNDIVDQRECTIENLMHMLGIRSEKLCGLYTYEMMISEYEYTMRPRKRKNNSSKKPTFCNIT